MIAALLCCVLSSEPYTVGVSPDCGPSVLHATAAACRSWERVCGVRLVVRPATGQEIFRVTLARLPTGRAAQSSVLGLIATSGLNAIELDATYVRRASPEMLRRTMLHEIGLLLLVPGVESTDPTSALHASAMAAEPNPDDAARAVRFFGGPR